MRHALVRLQALVATAATACLLACDAPATPSPAPPPPAASPALAGASGDPPAVRRLDAAAFPGLPTTTHGAVATIGDASRPVVASPSLEPVLEVLGVPLRDGRAAAEITLADAPRGASVGALSLRVQAFPAAMPEEVWDKIARDMPSKRISSAWTLERNEGTTATLAYTPAEPPDGPTRFHFYLDALRAAPSRLSSVPFAPPPGGRIELAFGVTTKTDAEDFSPIDFRASLECGDASSTDGTTRTLFTSRVRAGADPGWHEREALLSEAEGPCHLVLEARQEDGSAAPGAVWAVPRVVSPGLLGVARANASARNLILISLDTLRADHLSGYGYARPTSPTIDAELIARGTRFADVSTTYSRTDVSHMSLFSGLYPKARPDPRRLTADAPMPLLAEQLRDAGFLTAAFTEDGLLAGLSGFWFGFDEYTERTFQAENRGAATFGDGIRWLEQNGDAPFFLFLHTYKTHAPYVSSAAYRELFTDPAEWERAAMPRNIGPKHRETANAYDRTIREADALVGRLLASLEALGLAGTTLVVLTSDHGESLGEHGPTGHNYTPNQEVIRVPLVLRGPGVPAGGVVDAPVSLVDVAPTVLELLGVAPLAPAQGVSLVPALRGAPLPEGRPLHFAWLTEGSAGVRAGSLKYLESRARRELFDLATDPHETSALPEGERPRMRALLEQHAEASQEIRQQLTRRGGAQPEGHPVTTEDLERSLRALGYIE